MYSQSYKILKILMEFPFVHFFLNRKRKLRAQSFLRTSYIVFYTFTCYHQKVILELINENKDTQ